MGDIMSLYDYRCSIPLSSHDFYPLLMAAMRNADTTNIAKLKILFPDIYEELQARYNAPNGMLESEIATCECGDAYDIQSPEGIHIIEKGKCENCALADGVVDN